MQELIVPLITGGAVLAFALFLLRGHFIAWREQAQEPEADPRERDHYRRQFRRRVQASSLLAVLGVLLMLATDHIPWKRAPGMFAIYVLVLFVLLGWIVLLALGDLVSTRLHTRAALGRVQQKQQELEAALRALQRPKSNGSPEGPR